ncbi:hypothetical protein HPB49_019247 [Dermacentor silvarum]|uniref:Uncharacterized protein n=1 Tax=Dermacentor silvarum TaxID=543639 RepID=A0ACB8DQY1_DERSI|nr:uncharacterized protein LOC119466285 isoform X2 [Dermacentor silvarum]KAH7974773.1 hypothetical protein HPB49_019247 [Dermacentor silvarum]
MPHTEVATIACIFAVLAALHGASALGICTPSPTSANIGDRATCPFTMTTDVDPARIPSELPVTKCNCPDSRCSDVGDYRCQEVRSTFRVAYRVGGGTSSELTNKTVELTTSCVCIVNRSAGAVWGGQRTTGGDPHKPARFK